MSGLCKSNQGSPNEVIPDRQGIIPTESKNQSGGFAGIFPDNL